MKFVYSKRIWDRESIRDGRRELVQASLPLDDCLNFCSVCGMMPAKGRDRFRVVILELIPKKYIDGVLKSKVNFEFLVNLFVSENDRIH